VLQYSAREPRGITSTGTPPGSRCPSRHQPNSVKALLLFTNTHWLHVPSADFWWKAHRATFAPAS